MNEWLEDHMLLTPTHLLSSENCPPHLTPLTPALDPPPNHLHRHYSAKLSHLAGDVDDSGQGPEAGGMQTFLERMNLENQSRFCLL